MISDERLVEIVAAYSRLPRSVIVAVLDGRRPRVVGRRDGGGPLRAVREFPRSGLRR